MIKKCLGCGVPLQSDDANKAGYVEQLEGTYLCKRCFRIKNYGDYQVVKKDIKEYQNVFEGVKKKDNLILFVCDVLNLDSMLKTINEFGGNVILVITKKDLLPKSVKESKLLSYLTQNYNLNIITTIFVSSVKNYNLDALLSLIKKYKNKDEVYLVGSTNAGKSTLINAMVKSYSNSSYEVTTSVFPATTLDLLKVKINDEITLVDTPGLVMEDNYLTKVSLKDIKKISPKKEIKPKTYQIKPEQSLIIDNYVRIDYVKGEANSFTLYLSNALNVDRINLKTKDKLNDLVTMELDVPALTDVVISGLCFCKIVKPALIKVHIKKGVKVFLRPKLI